MPDILIPDWYIPLKKIDYASETLQFLGAAGQFGDLELPPPFIAYYSELELIGSEFYRNPQECTLADVGEALVLLRLGQRGLEFINSYQNGNEYPLQKATEDFLNDYAEDIKANYENIVKWVLLMPAEGLSMIPKENGGRPKVMVFDAQYLAQYAGVVSREANITINAALWEFPFIAAGHIMAAMAQRNGVKDVERPLDSEELKRISQETAERELKGVLHPWQKSHPERYAPSAEQIAANPEIIKEWESLKNGNGNDKN